MKTKNILYIAHCSGLMGATRSLVELIDGVKQKNFNITVLLPLDNLSDDFDIRNYLIKNNIKYIEAPITWIKSGTNYSVIKSYIKTFKYRNKIYDLVKNLDFDIVHSNSSVINIGAYIARKKNVRHIWHLREFGDLDYNLKTPFGKWFQKFIYRGNNEFIAISESILKHYTKYIPQKKITKIYNGLTWKELNKDKNYKRTKNIVIVGLIHRSKGQLDLIKAASFLIHNNIKNFKINLIGPVTTPYIEEINDYIKNNHMENYVQIWGKRNNIEEILKNQDIGVIASIKEGFGRVTIEYATNGLAIIASDSGANPELIKHNDTGLLYEEGNIYSLANQIESLINNKEKIKYLASNANTKLKTRFSSERYINEIVNLYLK